MPASSTATSADAVVWSTKMLPLGMPANIPFSPNTTWRRSSSLPTQQNTMSQFLAASAGVLAVVPENSACHFSAFSWLRLNTQTSCPAFCKCPAMGYPITPKPINATFIERILL